MKAELHITFDSVDELSSFLKLISVPSPDFKINPLDDLHPIYRKELDCESIKETFDKINAVVDVKKCAECGAEFTPSRKDAKYCSKKCQNKVHQRTYHEKKKTFTLTPEESKKKK
jgi:predicted nucleic acid-binding Zn ribbon protein